MMSVNPISFVFIAIENAITNLSLTTGICSPPPIRCIDVLDLDSLRSISLFEPHRFEYKASDSISQIQWCFRFFDTYQLYHESAMGPFSFELLSEIGPVFLGPHQSRSPWNFQAKSAPFSLDHHHKYQSRSPWSSFEVPIAGGYNPLKSECWMGHNFSIT